VKVSLSLRVVEDTASRDPLRPTYELAAAAEEAGFYAAFIGHHHFTPPYAAAPWVLLAAVAARTSELRLGTAIYLLPAHHPLDVAENVATLDRVSAGRVILGVGIGYREYEYEPFDVPYHHRGARMSEALEILPAAWSGKAVSYEGRHFGFRDVTVFPTPVQEPHPPIWLGAVARRAQERAARFGDGWISDLLEPLPREQHLADRYRRLCDAAGRPANVCLMRTGAVAAHREDLEAQWLPGVIQTFVDYWRLGARGRDEDGMIARLERQEAVTLPEFAANRLIGGTPDDCIDQIKQCKEAVDPDHLLISLSGPEPGPDSLLSAIQLFGRHVLPAVTGA
jgi:probable F420-dependent oxidoreductase